MPDLAPERVADLAAKQELLLAILREQQRDGMLLLDPANFSWLTAGASARGITDPAEHAALFVQSSYRWVMCSSVDTQRLFDEELDGLGFQVKEWPWSWGRAQLLADLCQGKMLVCDVPYGTCEVVGPAIQELRRRLSPFEQARLRDVGKDLAHALEATCRNINRGDSEEEVAGHLAHRLLHRGLEPVAVQASADGRLRTYRRHGPTPVKVEQTCVVQATARRYGLHATASRAVSFGPPDDDFRRDLEAACRWSAVLSAASSVGATVGDVFAQGQRILENLSYEHEWRLAPLGYVTGHAAKEMSILPGDKQRALEAGWAVVWLASIGAVTNADTILITPDGPHIVTPPELWPVKRIKIAGLTLDRPDVLVR